MNPADSTGGNCGVSWCELIVCESTCVNLHVHVNRDDVDDAAEMACAWSDYRKNHGVTDTKTAHKAFAAGWRAARNGDQSGPLR